MGKTTAVQKLLLQRPRGEVWAVLVNEFGSLGIDGALLQGGEAAGEGEQGCRMAKQPGKVSRAAGWRSSRGR